MRGARCGECKRQSESISEILALSTGANACWLTETRGGAAEPQLSPNVAVTDLMTGKLNTKELAGVACRLGYPAIFECQVALEWQDLIDGLPVPVL